MGKPSRSDATSDHNQLVDSQSGVNMPTVDHLRRVQAVTLELALIPDLATLNKRVTQFARQFVADRQVLLLIREIDDPSLKLGYAEQVPAAHRGRINKARLSLLDAEDDPVLSAWLRGERQIITSAEQSSAPVGELLTLLEVEHAVTLPWFEGETLVGVLLVVLDGDETLSTEEISLLNLLGDSSAVLLHHAQHQTDRLKKLADDMNEMQILQQIDRELSETIALSSIFSLVLDWTLRFTKANSASIALYDETMDGLRTVLNYGYGQSDEELEALRSHSDNTVTQRVARSGQVEVVPDVMMDKDYAAVEGQVRSQMAVPILREDRVIGVMTLESYKLNGFSDEHVDFVQKLATRAAVAVDNGRLYEETVRERERLSYILSNVGDVVIVIDLHGDIVLISQSALSALRLYSGDDYIGNRFSEVIGFTPLVNVYRRALDTDENQEGELVLPNGRSYFVRLTRQLGVGWIMVLQDITPFMEMSRLKSELIATVSHDLKQPLGVMRGYLDLLQMRNTFDSHSSGYVSMIDRSINNMRQLIDDLLDLAKIESGMDLEFEVVSVASLLRECIDSNLPIATSKSMTIDVDIEDSLPSVSGERSRLQQVFNNLIGNAIKYTPPEGTITVHAEQRGHSVRVIVQDNGLGISPADLSRIFDRFYRVRRPETESIDGTGLGLAIVKSLVEAHQGQIRVESTLGEGSTFFVTLPTL
jgi:signal transduction histidine kinase